MRLLSSGAELKLLSHPGGSASGFTTVRGLIPAENSQMSSSSRQTPPPPAHPSPVITGDPPYPALITRVNQHHPVFPTAPPADAVSACVCLPAVVSGEAAERVFKTHSVSVPVSGSRTTATSPDSSSPAAPAKPPLQGEPGSEQQAAQLSSEEQRSRNTPSVCFVFSGNLEPISPPDCQTCRSQYKLMAELRGFMCVSGLSPPRR